jgi:hypothetical protein
MPHRDDIKVYLGDGFWIAPHRCIINQASDRLETLVINLYCRRHADEYQKV